MTPFGTLWAGDLLDQAGLRPGSLVLGPAKALKMQIISSERTTMSASP